MASDAVLDKNSLNCYFQSIDNFVATCDRELTHKREVLKVVINFNEINGGQLNGKYRPIAQIAEIYSLANFLMK